MPAEESSLECRCGDLFDSGAAGVFAIADHQTRFMFARKVLSKDLPSEAGKEMQDSVTLVIDYYSLDFHKMHDLTAETFLE
jgi:hypothetical protein